MKESFLNRLAILAEICKHKLDSYQTELYDRELKDIGYEVLCSTLDKITINRKSNERFPSIKEIKELVKLAGGSVLGIHTTRTACKVCDTFGSVLRTRDKILFAYQCTSCEAGAKNFGGLPMYRN